MNIEEAYRIDIESAKDMIYEQTEEIERLKEEYMILQNASDEVEEEKDKEIERLNNIINSIDARLIEMGVNDEILDICEMYDVNGIELRKMIQELKGSNKE